MNQELHDELKQALDRINALQTKLTAMEKQPKPTAGGRVPMVGTLGGVIQNERERQRRTQTDVMRKAGFSTSILSTLECSQNSNLHLSTLVAICLSLGVRTSEIIRRLEEENPVKYVPCTEAPPLVLAAE